MSYSYWVHALQLLKPARQELVLHNEKRHRSENPVNWNQSSPNSLQLVKAFAKQWRPSAAKNNFF